MLRPNVLNVSIMPSQEVGFHEATHVILLDTFQWWGDVDEGPVAEPFVWPSRALSGGGLAVALAGTARLSQRLAPYLQRLVAYRCDQSGSLPLLGKAAMASVP